MLNMFAVVLMIVATLVGAIGSLYLKKGSGKFTLNPFQQLKNLPLVLGLFLSIISVVMYLFVLRIDKLSIIYPLTAFTYIWIAIFSVVFLGEKMNKNKVIGIALIILGIFLATYF